MTSGSAEHDRDYLELVFLHALRALPANEIPVLEAHLAACADCRHEMDALRPIVAAFVSWPTDVLRPAESLWERLAQRIGAKAQAPIGHALAIREQISEWEEPAPGIFCKLLATDTERDRVSMLVRLAPGVAYPPHDHAGVEELYLLHGELVIDEKKLYPGDYNRAEPGTGDQLVWSETGCTCLLITSTQDILR